MAKHLYSIGFDKIKHHISNNKDKISYHLKQSCRLELSKKFGKSFYDIAIYDFFDSLKILQNTTYAIQIYNYFKSKTFIDELYTHLGLDMFDNTIDKQVVFYSFVYYLFTSSIKPTQDIQQKLFYHYFLHNITIVNKNTSTSINYKDMALSYIKNKDITIKESYVLNKDTKIVDFKLLINSKVKIKLEGKSIKTLRKQAYKKIFLYLIDEARELDDDKKLLQST